MTSSPRFIAIAGALRLADAHEGSEIIARARWALESLGKPRAA